MSTNKVKIPYATAKKVADAVLELLKPYCTRIEIAGSIRRMNAMCGDIEIVCIPNPDLRKEFATVVDQWAKLTGDALEGKAMKRMVYYEDDEIKGIQVQLDLFTATVDNWGYIYAIRTGSADYSHKILANGWVKAGYHGSNGMLMDSRNNPIPVKEEQELFDLIGIAFKDPDKRNL